LWGGKLCPDGKLQPFKGGIDLRFNTMYKASRQPVSSPSCTLRGVLASRLLMVRREKGWSIEIQESFSIYCMSKPIAHRRRRPNVHRMGQKNTQLTYSTSTNQRTLNMNVFVRGGGIRILTCRPRKECASSVSRVSQHPSYLPKC
jgi:hypothetical protein